MKNLTDSGGLMSDPVVKKITLAETVRVREGRTMSKGWYLIEKAENDE